MQIIENLQKLSEDIPRRRKAAVDEAKTESFLLDPFIRLLGYEPSEPNDVERQHTADIGIQREKVDYALMKEGRPVILIEVKPATSELGDYYAAQLRRYFGTKLETRFGILTNGLEYHFYADLEQPNVMDDEPFLKIDMESVDISKASELNIFSKSEFNVDRAVSAAQNMKNRSKIETVVNDAFNPLSDELIELLIRKVYKGKLTKFVRNDLAPLVLQAWQEFLKAKTVAKPPIQLDGHSGTPDGSGSNIPPQSYKPAPKGGIRLPVYIDYQPRGSKTKHRLHGTLILTDSIGRNQNLIEYEGEILPPSEAAGRAIRSVNPGVSNPNGWRYWTFVNPNTGRNDVIDLLTNDSKLRRQLLQGRDRP
ncbi:MAG: type I restriction endonuclease [Chloroflexi bacterium]|nr:type I restriction endonuclease [Chloroflexota bacterium]